MITAAIMVLLVPQWLTDLGFILSFISSWALLAMVGDMEQTALVMPQRLKGFWHTFVVPTMTAQIGVMPVLFAGIGVVYLIGFFANVLVLPLVPILMVLSGGLLVLTYVSVEVAGVLSFIVEFAAYPVIAIITLVSKVPLGITWTFAPLLALIGYSLFITYSLYREPRLW